MVIFVLGDDFFVVKRESKKNAHWLDKIKFISRKVGIHFIYVNSKNNTILNKALQINTLKRYYIF